MMTMYELRSMDAEDILMRINEAETALWITEESFKGTKKNHDALLANHMILVDSHAKMLNEWKNKEAAYQGTVHSLEHKIWAMKDEMDALKRDNERINKEYFNLNRNLELSSTCVGDLKKERDQWQIWHNEIVFKYHDDVQMLKDENTELKKKVESYENCIKMTQSYFDSLDYERMPAPKIVWIPTPNTSKEEFDKLKEEFRQRIRDAYLKSTFDFNQFDIQKVIEAYKKELQYIKASIAFKVWVGGI